MTPDLESMYAEHVARLGRAYDRILEAQQLDAVLLHSGVPRTRSIFDDQAWPLRVVPHFAHFLPLLEADCVLVVRAGKKPTLVRFVGFDFWEQPPQPVAHALSQVEVVAVRSHDEARAALPVASARVAFIGEDEPAAARFGHTLSTSADLLRAVNETRVHKSVYDLHCLAEANRIAARGHLAVRHAFFSGTPHSELDLHLVYLRETEQDDPETPYKNILALGVHAATLHHVSYGRKKEGGATSLLVDAGVSYLGYASDITRTYARGRSAEVDAFQQLLAGVERFQQTLCAEITVGRPYESLHDQAHVYLGEVLRDVGVVRGTVQEAVERGITRAFLPHGLGHSLGITTHDVGCAELKPRADNPFLRNTRKIEIDQVFTIEPGCYFIPDLLAPVRHDDRKVLVDWKLVDALAPLGGIRIEDDVRVRPAGAPQPDGTGRQTTIDNLTRTFLPA